MAEAFIVKYVQAIRNIQEKQISEYEKLILNELTKLIPTLPDDGTDWLCDLLMCDNDQEVVETLDRIREIEEKRISLESQARPTNEELEKRVQRMADYIEQLEQRLNQLETQYEEPTN